jgi:hypothetical protein
MNCKPGDLAVVVGASVTPEMIGCIVKVVRLAVKGEYLKEARFTGESPAWVCESDSGIPIRTSQRRFFRTTQRAINDSNLRPIRDNDKEDETLSWAGKPQSIPKETA